MLIGRISCAANYVRPLAYNYSKLEPRDIKFFKKTLIAPESVIQNPAEIKKYNEEYRKKYEGTSQCVLRPSNVNEVSAVLAYCNSRVIPVVPQGGRTSLVVGATPLQGEVVISLERLNKIYELSPYTGIIKVQAGTVLEEVDKYCNERGFAFPLDLGARGSCQIGGNLSTNAGGLHFVKYGSLRGNVIGLRGVLPNGYILDTLDSHRKDNTGYDLKQLFIGSEGTLGIITDAAVLCYPQPSSISLCYLGVDSIDMVKEILAKAKQKFGSNLSAIEMMDNNCYELVLKNIAQVRAPFEERYPYYMVIETHHNGSQEESNNLLLSFIDSFGDKVKNAIMAMDKAQAASIWQVREKVADAFERQGPTYKFDVSVKVDEFEEIINIVRNRVKDIAIVGGYGHVGDGNIHMNVTGKNKEETEQVGSLLEPYVLEEVGKRKGSISAEHGIGYAKAKYLGLSKSKEYIETMKVIKKALDPNNIMNPGKVFHDL